MSELRVFSFGGGVQSTAVLVLQITGQLAAHYDVFCFANVGDDSENPHTLRYVRDVVAPYAAEHGIPLIEVQRRRAGEPDTLVSAIYRPNRSVPIPARMSNGAPGNRTCTGDFKINVVDGWIKRGGYERATVGLGISIDEFTRMRDTDWHDANRARKFGFLKRREYPLIDLRLTRADCVSIIADAGLPPAPKSSCFFCPFMRRNEWIELKRNDPNLFERAAAIEDEINRKRSTMAKDRLYLHPSLRPLRDAVGDQLPMWSDDDCESGYCHT